MTQQDIRNRRDYWRHQLAAAQAQLVFIQSELDVLVRQCEHPHAYTSNFVRMERACPDCGAVDLPAEGT